MLNGVRLDNSYLYSLGLSWSHQPCFNLFCGIGWFTHPGGGTPCPRRAFCTSEGGGGAVGVGYAFATTPRTAPLLFRLHLARASLSLCAPSSASLVAASKATSAAVALRRCFFTSRSKSSFPSSSESPRFTGLQITGCVRCSSTQRGR